MPEGAATGQPGNSQRAAQPAGRRGRGARIRPALRRFRWPGILVAAGLGLIALAYLAVYPRPEIPIPVPASPSLVIYTSGLVGQVSYVVTKDAAGLPEVRITVTLASGLIGGQVVPLPVPPQNSPSIELTLPPGLAFRNCGGACVSYAGEAAWVQPLDFTGTPETATDVFPVETADFGADVSDVYAYAAIPEVTFMNLTPAQAQEQGVKVLPPTLRAQYLIPAAGSYDWSAGPVPTVSGPTATWQEILAASDTPGQTASGLNHGRQVHDADFTFLAGFLIGLAGSVVLAGLQLLLPPAPGSDASRSGASRKETGG